MKLSVNRNIIWCEIFVRRLAELGVKYVCISPGSRSTPLTLAFASKKSIQNFSIIDERSSAFFALGLAKKTKSPVAVVTTSGTAVAELYPAIIEAYYQRIPLIICTADRPRELRNSGANQTINQQNIYRNHIRYFIDAGLPDVKKINRPHDLADNLIETSCFNDRGPVHINFPFEKPFEPFSFTDKIEMKSLSRVLNKKWKEPKKKIEVDVDYNDLTAKFLNNERGLILVGYNNYQNDFSAVLYSLSNKLGYPVYYDGSSSLRYNSIKNENFIESFTAFIRSKNFQKHFDPKIIIQFGNAPTSNVILEFFKNSKSEKILVNEFGDRNDPSLTAKNILKENPASFCNNIIRRIQKGFIRDSCWQIDFNVMNNHAINLKHKLIDRAKFPFEGKIVTELFKSIPEDSNLFISNSLPIRDADFFASVFGKRINVYTNRGASGIDGINSTALGIAKTSKTPTFLLVGDLAFFHDLNGLHNAIKYKIPLTIILVNNHGGGIFESLPISNYRKYLKENFLTPLELDLSKLVKAYGGTFIKVKSWKNFTDEIKLSSKNKLIRVLEIQTNAKSSKSIRNKYWNAVVNKIDNYINEITS